jgi:hypothetical protein
VEGGDADPPGFWGGCIGAAVDTNGGGGESTRRDIRELGLTRHPDKGYWGGAQVLGHLGVLIDTRKMWVFVTDRKVQHVRRMAQEILLGAQRNRRLLTLALPMARFYTRSRYWDMSLAGLRVEERGQSQRKVRRVERGGQRAQPPFVSASAPRGPRLPLHALSAPEQP